MRGWLVLVVLLLCLLSAACCEGRSSVTGLYGLFLDEQTGNTTVSRVDVHTGDAEAVVQLGSTYHPTMSQSTTVDPSTASFFSVLDSADGHAELIRARILEKDFDSTPVQGVYEDLNFDLRSGNLYCTLQKAPGDPLLVGVLIVSTGNFMKVAELPGSLSSAGISALDNTKGVLFLYCLDHADQNWYLLTVSLTNGMYKRHSIKDSYYLSSLVAQPGKDVLYGNIHKPHPPFENFVVELQAPTLEKESIISFNVLSSVPADKYAFPFEGVATIDGASNLFYAIFMDESRSSGAEVPTLLGFDMKTGNITSAAALSSVPFEIGFLT